MLVPWILGLFGCLIERDLYEMRRAELVDDDGDGWSLLDGDCDTEDASTYPEAPEVPYDGVDQDCDGSDVTDVDGDGDDGEPAGGGDCDDEDPTRASTIPETWDDDGVDNDCDGDTLDALTWDAGSSATRIDGIESGGELGRRIVAWPDGECLLLTAPYLETSRGVVYAEPYGAGMRSVGEGGVVTGSAEYAYLAALDVSAAGVVLLGEPTVGGGAGRVSFAEGATLCSGGSPDLADLPSVGGPGENTFVGSAGRWMDVDGDGVQDLALPAPGADGEAQDDGAVAFFFGASGEELAWEDADARVTGGHAGASLEDVVLAEDRASGDGYLLFVRGPSPSGVSLRRVRASALASGSVDDIADGGLTTTTDPLLPTVVGDVTTDGVDEVVVGAADWGLWSVEDISGVRDAADAPTRLVAEGDEWLTGFVATGDVDGGGKADLLLLADDWPAGSARGRLAFLFGESLLVGSDNVFESQRLLAQGGEVGDTFGYRGTPAGDMDGDGRLDLAVVAYGTDFGGASAGSVYALPLP